MENNLWNLTALLEPVVQRQNLVDEILTILRRKIRNFPLLVGEQGTGKTTLIRCLAARFYNKDVPDELKNYTVYELCQENSQAGSFHETIKKLEGEKTILFIDDIANFFFNKSSISISHLLRSCKQAGILIIGASTKDDLNNIYKSLPILDRHFTKVLVNEPDTDKILVILKFHADLWKNQFDEELMITDELLKYLIDTSYEHMAGVSEPEKSLQLLYCCFNVLDKHKSKTTLWQSMTKELIEFVIRHEQHPFVHHQYLDNETLFKYINNYKKNMPIIWQSRITKCINDIKSSSFYIEKFMSRKVLDLILSFPCFDKKKYVNYYKEELEDLMTRVKSIISIKFFDNEDIIEMITARLINHFSAQHTKILCFSAPQGSQLEQFVKWIAYEIRDSVFSIDARLFKNQSYLFGSPPISGEAQPGCIFSGIVRCKSLNPVVIITNIDQLLPENTSDFLNLINPYNNIAFRDKFVDVSLDLNDAFFICTATTSPFTDEVSNNLDIIEIPGCCFEDCT